MSTMADRTVREIDAEIAQLQQRIRDCVGWLYPRILMDDVAKLYIERREAYYRELALDESENLG